MKFAKIIMGLHPHIGWRSFKTDTDVLDEWQPKPLLVAGVNLILPRTREKMTPFGRHLLGELQRINQPINAEYILYRQRQFEIFVPHESGGWEAHRDSILKAIAIAHSGTYEYELEIRDMSYGLSVRGLPFKEEDEELEEIEERENSFAPC